MEINISGYDIALICVVTFLAVGVAYVPSPRAKSLFFSLPLPFSAAILSINQSADATNIIGFIGGWTVVWGVYYLYAKRGWNIILAEVVGLAYYCGLSYCIPLIMPRGCDLEPYFFWGLLVGMVLVSLLMFRYLPPKAEPHHKSPMPMLLKTILVLAIVCCVVLAKSHMRGFVTAFPFVTTFALYEGRFCLYSMARRMPSFYLGVPPLLIAMRYLPDMIGMWGALAMAWACFVPVLMIMDRVYSKRDQRLLAQEYKDIKKDEPELVGE